METLRKRVSVAKSRVKVSITSGRYGQPSLEAVSITKARDGQSSLEALFAPAAPLSATGGRGGHLSLTKIGKGQSKGVRYTRPVADRSPSSLRRESPWQKIRCSSLHSNKPYLMAS